MHHRPSSSSAAAAESSLPLSPADGFLRGKRGLQSPASRFVLAPPMWISIEHLANLRVFSFFANSSGDVVAAQ
jgi:hypothetical protein